MELGFLLDFREVKTHVKEVLSALDHHDLNALPVFRRQNPTSENLARYLYDSLSGQLNCPRYSICRVTVCETPGTTASYWAEAKRKAPEAGGGKAGSRGSPRKGLPDRG